MSETTLKTRLAAGGVVTFHGHALLSRIIEFFCPSHGPKEMPLSHIALIPPREYWIGDQPSIIESTIWRGVSGPQYNVLADRLSDDYRKRGCRAWFLPFLQAPNWPAVHQAAVSMFEARKQGKMHYGVKRLFQDAAESIPGHDYILPLDLIAEIGKCDAGGIVCSECVALLEQAGGVSLPWPVLCCKPEQVRDLPIYGEAISILPDETDKAIPDAIMGAAC